MEDTLRYMYHIFPIIFSKGDNHCDCLFAFLGHETFPKGGLFSKEFKGQVLPFKSELSLIRESKMKIESLLPRQGVKNENRIFASSENLTIYLKKRF